MKQSKIMERIIAATDLNTQILPGQPLVELTDTGRVLIENHLGVLQYGKQLICVKMRYGSLCITGAELELAKMTKEQLVITGRILSIEVSSGGHYGSVEMD